MQKLRQVPYAMALIAAVLAGLLAYAHSKMTSKDPLADHGSAFLRTTVAAAVAFLALTFASSAPAEAGTSSGGAGLLEPFDPVPAAPGV